MQTGAFGQIHRPLHRWMFALLQVVPVCLAFVVPTCEGCGGWPLEVKGDGGLSFVARELKVLGLS